MSEVVKLSPEGLEVANAYLQMNSIEEVAEAMHVSTEEVLQVINKPDVKNYINEVYLDSGYRNRFKFWNLLDKIVEQKLEEAEENEFYSSKDLMDILMLMHKMKMEEMKLAQKQGDNIKQQTNVQINSNEGFGEGNYGDLMKRLIGTGE